MKEWAPLWGPILTAVVAGFGVFIAYRALRRQIEHSNASLDALKEQIEFSRNSLNINLTLQLDKQFNDPQFMVLRKKAIQSIKDKKYGDVDEILDFFETVSLLVKRKALDVEIVWHTFFWWFHRYYKATQGYILKMQVTEPTIWEDLKYLYDQLLTMEKSRNPNFSEELSEADLEEFIEFEEAVPQ